MHVKIILDFNIVAVRNSCQCKPPTPPVPDTRPCCCLEAECGCPTDDTDWMPPEDEYASDVIDGAAAAPECRCDDDCDCDNAVLRSGKDSASSDCQCGPRCECDGGEEAEGGEGRATTGGDVSSKIMMMVI